MEKEIYYAMRKGWQKFLSQLQEEYRLYAPGEGIAEPEFHEIGSPDDISRIIHTGARLTLPLKYFVCPPREKVGSAVPTALWEQKSVVLGVKACDLKALAVLDKIFLDPDFIDPFYKERRQNTLLISDDCTEPRESCFCILLKGKPFPDEGFDLNLSFLPGADDGILIEIGSDKGKDLIEKHKLPVRPASDRELKTRAEKRQEVIRRLEEINKDFKFPENPQALVKSRYDSPAWEKVSEKCVGCAACTNICPACHCFFLALNSVDRFDKARFWDSCQYGGFARVAGGANPMGKLGQRFRNRFYCKFEYKPENFGILGCTGCGRCIEACQGKIDVREALNKVDSSK